MAVQQHEATARERPRAVPLAVRTLIGLLVACAVLLTGAPAAQADTTTRPSDPAVAEAEFLALLNAERARAGLPALVLDPNLTNDARAWSKQMADFDTLAHTPILVEETARSVPDWRRAGENIGYGWSVESLHQLLVDSPPHYANISGDFNRVGVGVHYTDEHTWVTFRFVKSDNQVGVAATGSVRRLYLAFFKREPDPAGSLHWVARVLAGLPLGGISGEFVASGEFLAKYGALSDSQFVDLVYRNVMGRSPDGAGYDYWTSQMRRGLSRGQLMVGFSESAEFRTLTGG